MSHADHALARLRGDYEESLHALAISASLQIDVKNLIENYRSTLDFLAGWITSEVWGARRNEPDLLPPGAGRGSVGPVD